MSALPDHDRPYRPAVVAVTADNILTLTPAARGTAYLTRRGFRPMTCADSPARWVCPGHGRWLAELSARGATIVIATTGQPAAPAVAAILGHADATLELPAGTGGVRFGRAGSLPHLAAYAHGAPLAVLHSCFGGKDPGWARQRTAAGHPTLLREVHPRRGLCRHHINDLHAWLDTLIDQRISPRAPLVAAPLTGHDANIYAILARATDALRHHGYRADADQMKQRILGCHSYGEALTIVCQYVTDSSPGSKLHRTSHPSEHRDAPDSNR